MELQLFRASTVREGYKKDLRNEVKRKDGEKKKQERKIKRVAW